MDHDEGMSVLLANGGFFGHFRTPTGKCSTFYLDDEVLQDKQELLEMFCRDIVAYITKQRIKVKTIVCPQNAIRFSIVLKRMLENKTGESLGHLYVPPTGILDCAKPSLEYSNVLILDTACMTGQNIGRLANLVTDCNGYVVLAAVMFNHGRETASSLLIEDLYACIEGCFEDVDSKTCRLCADGVPWDKVPQIAVSV